MENKKKKQGEKGEGGGRARTDNTIDDTAQQRAKSDLPFTEPSDLGDLSQFARPPFTHVGRDTRAGDGIHIHALVIYGERPALFPRLKHKRLHLYNTAINRNLS